MSENDKLQFKTLPRWKPQHIHIEPPVEPPEPCEDCERLTADLADARSEVERLTAERDNEKRISCCPECNFKGLLYDSPTFSAGGAEYCGKPDCVCHIRSERNPEYVGGSPEKQKTFGDDLRRLINSHSLENDSNTPDIVLACYLLSCLKAFNCSVNSRNNLTANLESGQDEQGERK
jgi:hypothetical protein